MAYVDITSSSYGTTIRVTYTQTPNSANNTSTITITKLQVSSTKYAGLYYLDGQITINGSTVIDMDSYLGTHRVSINYSNGTLYNVGSEYYGSATVAHDADGNATITIGCTSVKGVYNGDNKTKWTVSGTAKATLDKVVPDSGGDDSGGGTTSSTNVIYISNGTSFDAYEIYIDNGVSWDKYAAYIDNGSSWDVCG